MRFRLLAPFLAAAVLCPVPLASGPAAAAPDAGNHRDGPRPATLAELRARLDDSDRAAALEALHTALSEVGDDGVYIWRRQSRGLTGAIRPTRAFRDAQGRPCRHLVYVLGLGGYTKSIETIACRAPDGRWIVAG